ncbi:hypothetical protein LCGC14_3036270, partial [marine sediment metagenome]
MAYKKLRETLDTEDMEDMEFGSASIKPRQTRHYPCVYWNPVKKCVSPYPKIRKVEVELRANKEDSACSGIKPSCPTFDYPEPYIPEIDEYHILDEDKAETVIYALKQGDNLLIVGPPGCGKSSTVMQLASILNWETNRF